MVGSAGRGGDVSVAWNSYFVGLTNTVIANSSFEVLLHLIYCISFNSLLFTLI